MSQVLVPDIGDFSDVPVIEIHVKEGDTVNAEDPLITLESDKATLDVPAPSPGTVTEVLVSIGDRVRQGSPVVSLAPGDGALTQPPSLVEQQEPEPTSVAQGAPPSAAAPQPAAPAGAAAQAAPAPAAGGQVAADGRELPGAVHAGPSVRRLARELQLDLSTVRGSGPKGRITKDDLLATLRSPAPPTTSAASGSGIPEIPAQDFARFGPVDRQPLSRIKRVSGPHLHRSWLNVPHVTHNDEADISVTEAYRKELDSAAKADGYRVTLLAFLVKAAVSALKAFPAFNSSLSPEKDELILKRYYNIGIAVDTPDGLVVPVVKDADRKGIIELSKEFANTSKKARDGKLSAADMQGGTFTISSLGGIGGTSFTPIVNAPEVAILGVVRSKQMPVWTGESFQPRLMLPLSLSYDHRVIDGALAARFVRHLATSLEDPRRLLL